MLALSPASVWAQGVKLPSEAPVPELRPYFPTSSVAASASSILGSLLKTAPEHQRLREGLEAIAAGNVATAKEARDALASGSRDRKILTWALALSNHSEVSGLDIAKAKAELKDWPGLNRLEAAQERALYREEPPLQSVLASLGQTKPQTVEGTILLARAYLAADNPAAAHALLSPFWRTGELTDYQEDRIISEFGALLTEEDHRFRTERMLYAGRIASADRVAHLAKMKELVAAWRAVERNASKASEQIEAVAKAQRTAAWHFLKARQLRRSQKFEEAARILQAVDPSDAEKVDPDAWWVERRALSRELLDIKQEELAHKVAAAYTGGTPVAITDAEFHAGWYALRFMDDPITAVAHFQRMNEVANGPISLARAHYWIGRAAEAGAPDIDAQKHYAEAARYSTAFYGQLAAAKIGQTKLASSLPSISPEQRLAFAAREPVKAILRLQEIGFDERAGVLYRDLGEELASAEDLALLIEMAEKAGKHYLALRIAKAGSSRGLEIGSLTHPVGVIPKGTTLSGAGEALAYAIARQESEFNVGAVSQVGARGLLQLMPATAREVARKNGLPFSALKLTSDAGYNATLGAAYLDEQLARFGGSYILTFIGYNAGPRRANEWIERYGDPRGKPLEQVIDWVERIPFTETRGYVQRVLENYQIYKAQLTGQFEIERDLVHGRSQ
ncbi:lytic transglycosylase domain-containing protein [Nitratireductor aestuarii]|uniref:lytic transglycosylase domain-containing protein n=1 Tax=Nitratireductor aestuarii TaxID=1735103 RepID=UPI00166D62CA